MLEQHIAYSNAQDRATVVWTNKKATSEQSLAGFKGYLEAGIAKNLVGVQEQMHKAIEAANFGPNGPQGADQLAAATAIANTAQAAVDRAFMTTEEALRQHNASPGFVNQAELTDYFNKRREEYSKSITQSSDIHTRLFALDGFLKRSNLQVDTALKHVTAQQQIFQFVEKLAGTDLMKALQDHTKAPDLLKKAAAMGDTFTPSVHDYLKATRENNIPELMRLTPIVSRGINVANGIGAPTSATPEELAAAQTATPKERAEAHRVVYSDAKRTLDSGHSTSPLDTERAITFSGRFANTGDELKTVRDAVITGNFKKAMGTQWDEGRLAAGNMALGYLSAENKGGNMDALVEASTHMPAHLEYVARHGKIYVENKKGKEGMAGGDFLYNTQGMLPFGKVTQQLLTETNALLEIAEGTGAGKAQELARSFVADLNAKLLVAGVRDVVPVATPTATFEKPADTVGKPSKPNIRPDIAGEVLKNRRATDRVSLQTGTSKDEVLASYASTETQLTKDLKEAETKGDESKWQMAANNLMALSQERMKYIKNKK